MGTFCIYFENKAVRFTGSAAEGDAAGRDAVSLTLDNGESLSPAKLLKNLGNNKEIYLVSGDPAGAYAAFCSQFTEVEAAGGVVRNAAGKILMMRRRGWWDLPKGHVEPGESDEQAALREVEEETGLKGVRIGSLLAQTRHFYHMGGRWEMKRTAWHRMYYDGTAPPVPQTEEDITEIRWMDSGQLQEALEGTYATIRDVVEEFNS